MVLRWGLAQLLSRLSLARCTQTVCWLLLLVAGLSGAAAAAAVDVHPAARRGMFDDNYGLQASIDHLDVHGIPDTGFGFPGSSLTYGSLAVRCSEM
jgi:hypothetical protein